MLKDQIWDQLTAWYNLNGRDLPWRRTRDPYAVWVSEIMLQQTQVATVLPYYDRWMTRFPNVESLANADEQEVLALWQGLGYYRRCRNLLAAAQTVAEVGYPTTAKGWRDIPGVGAYTAAAIASITLDEQSAVVDGNVERVFARVTASAATGSRLNRDATIWAQSLIPSENPGDWNQAMMELGATICTPKNPKCEQCPIAKLCAAHAQRDPARYPVKVPNKAIVPLEFQVWVPLREGLVGVRQIPKGEWWEGMWEFPREEDDAVLRLLLRPAETIGLGLVRHTVTHHRITLTVKLVRVRQGAGKDLRWLSLEELEALPMPAPQRKIARLVAQNLTPAMKKT
ncbi:MAG: A/G-specific adenine glycosylase [Fimbriimonadaceae bacterium]|nr:A/G-specific adenine glycosylase [Fimbriimonadaceae bacterium]